MDAGDFAGYPGNCLVASLNSDGSVKCTTCKDRYTPSSTGDKCLGKSMKYTND